MAFHCGAIESDEFERQFSRDAGNCMRAVALIETGKVEIVDMPMPTFGNDEILVKVTGVGICGSDLTVFEGHREVPEYPWIMGHEAVGVVAEIGANVTTHRVGQKVVLEPNYCCMHCSSCLSGATSGCENRVIICMTTPGYLAEYVAVPAEFAWPAPSELSTPELVCLEPCTVGEAALRRSGAKKGESALVVGAGSTGLLLLISLLEKGIDAYVSEPYKPRADLAVELGAKIHDVSRQYQYVFETSGSVRGSESAIHLARPGGTIVLLGLATEPVNMVPAEIVRGRLTIMGSMIYDHPQDFFATTANPPKRLSKVIRGEFAMENAQRAFMAARDVAGKSWISVSSEGELA